MKPSLYTLQISNDGITFTDATNWKTGALITSTNLDTLWNYIHRYREYGQIYYYRVKGTSGSATPIYSNIISKTYFTHTMSLHSINTGENYAVGMHSSRVYAVGDVKPRHIKKLSTPISFSRFYGQKVNGDLYFSDGITSSNLYKWNISNETLTILPLDSSKHFFTYGMAYYSGNNSLYFVNEDYTVVKYNISTATSTIIVSNSLANKPYGFPIIIGDFLYITPTKTTNKIYKINLTNDTLVNTHTCTTLNTATSISQYINPIYVASKNAIYIPQIRAGNIIKYDLSTDTTADVYTGITNLHYLSTLGPDGITLQMSTGNNVRGTFNTTTNVYNAITENGSVTTGASLLESGKIALLGDLTAYYKIIDTGATLAVNPMDMNINQ